MSTLLELPFVYLGIGGVSAIFVVFVIWAGTRVIGEQESGLIVKRWGKNMPAGRIVATGGEAGYQARMLPPGWHFFLWRWQYKVEKVPMIQVEPGEIALIVAADGAPIPANRILAREVPCDSFQDAEAFLRGGGERGRQLAFLTAGAYRINPALFEVITADNAAEHGLMARDLLVTRVPADRVGIVTTLDGHSITNGDVAGPPVPGHESFQRGQAFIDAGGSRGLQEHVLMAGSWNLNPWFASVEEVPMTEVPIGYVGVVVSYVGREHLDVSGEDFTHGDLVERGRKGVWVEPLLPGKHPLNTRIMRMELVPTTNIVLNWATRTEAHNYDSRLSSIQVRSKDGFAFMLDVATIIHVGMKNAPRVISRVGSLQNLVDHVLQPTVGNYFRNSAQHFTVLDFLSARTERQKEAYQAIKLAIEAYDVECIDSLIGDIVPPESLMKTQTDRKIAEESRRTFEVQREAQIKRQDLERETAIADMQAEVVRSEQTVRISNQTAMSHVESKRGEASSTTIMAEAEAAAARVRAQGEMQATRLRAEGEAEAIRQTGAARAEAYKLGIDALGAQGYVALQIAGTLAEHNMKLVPDIAVGGGGNGHGSSGLAEVLIARMLSGTATTPGA